MATFGRHVSMVFDDSPFSREYLPSEVLVVQEGSFVVDASVDVSMYVFRSSRRVLLFVPCYCYQGRIASCLGLILLNVLMPTVLFRRRVSIGSK